MVEKNVTISWQGDLFANHSLAHVNRELALRLIDKGFAITFDPTEPDSLNPSDDPRFNRLKAIENLVLKLVDITIRHQWPPDFTPPMSGHFIMIQPWEFGSLPKNWIEPMNTVVDEVWVPSNYVKECYITSGVEAARIQVVPNGVDTSTLSPEAPPLYLKTAKGFRFLFVGGTIHRKGIDLLLGAYRTAFSVADDVCLVIKDMGGNSFYQGQTAQELIGRFQSDPQAPEIEYIDTDFSTNDMAGLYTACHCLVHPYRGEGFGLPIAETMACGLAPIVTGYGAALDFCPPEIAWLLPAIVEKLPVKKVGQLETVDYPWLAEPDFDLLVSMLRHVANNPEEVHRRGKAAAAFIRENYTWEHAARIADERLRAVAKRPVRRFAVNATDSYGGVRVIEAKKNALILVCDQADRLAQSGKVDQAIQLLLNQGIRANPDNPLLYVELTEILIRAGRYLDALEVLSEMPATVVEETKKEFEAVCYCALGEDRAARNAADQIVKQPRAQVVLGTLAARQGDLQLAESYFRQVITAAPNCGNGWLSLGMLLWGQGKQEDAWQAVKQAVVVDPLNTEAVSILGDMAERMDCQSTALQILSTTVQSYPDARHLALNHAKLLVQCNRNAEVLKACERFFVRFGVDAELLSLTQQFSSRVGTYDRLAEGGAASVSLCMIVKNEEGCLVRCLASVKSVVHELVVVDTGSSDRTVAIATAFGARLLHFSWNGSFSDARNYGLEQAKGAWILVLDADEVISLQDHKALLAATSAVEKPSAFSVVTRNYTTMVQAQGWTANDGSYPEEERADGWRPSWKVRLFSNDARFRFRGDVHEMVEASLREASVNIQHASFVVHHYGELDQDPVKLIDKKQHYFEIGMQKLDQYPDDMAAICELAVQAGELGRFEEAVGLWDRVLQHYPDYVEALFNKGYCLMGLQQYDEALAHSYRALELDPDHKEAAFNYGTCELYVGDPQEAIKKLVSLAEKYSDYPLLTAVLLVLYLAAGHAESAFVYLEKLKSSNYAVKDYVMARIHLLEKIGAFERARIVSEGILMLGSGLR
ncbi:Glycosyltransferase involved in cell wall bisynthesis [Trichlorobacter thiogenes]|uniref:Glycosyltransferase involved in cell wall bisynthesis n=1 Tax=Trichlorobacter thiogenes TaxID=115783 RepID=A0A1T4JWL9_9BACT|nr:tetratricopeptide repeat protein [Trichlorobacter thiogenes]SJZ34551.1 Glycosyltransferase involved in cell wall bisynthesis [Trichlorobacter thiogenes]